MTENENYPPFSNTFINFWMLFWVLIYGIPAVYINMQYGFSITFWHLLHPLWLMNTGRIIQRNLGKCKLRTAILLGVNTLVAICGADIALLIHSNMITKYGYKREMVVMYNAVGWLSIIALVVISAELRVAPS